MSITFQGYTQAQGFGVPTLSPSYPTNASGMVLLAVVNVVRTDGSFTSPVVTAPAGWTLEVDNSSFGLGVYRAVWSKLGDGSAGPMIWAFDTNIRGNVNVLVYDEINTTTPIDVTASFHNDTSVSTNHPATSITTVTANALVIGCFFSADTGIGFVTNPPSLASIRVNLAGTTGSAERPTLICDGVQVVAGATGIKAATTNSGTFGQEILVALRPAPNPSVPVLTFPNGGEALTVGAVVGITWSPSTSPTAIQNTLKYNIEHSSNNGGSWSNVVTLTAAGAVSYPWTVPAVIGTGNLIRIRANDPALSLFSLAYDQSDAAFSIVAETIPGQPTITAPVAGSVQNKAINVTVAWMHQGGPGNPQTEFTLQWANNVVFTSPTTVGPTTTATQGTSIDFSAQASGTTIYVRVKTKGVSLYSSYSNVTSFVVASLPATPNITAPTNASPPNVPLPTITFTEADFFVARRFRIGADVFEVASSALSFESPHVFLNGVPVTFFLSVKSPLGLWSAEDSETVTPAYSGPATPVLTVQAVDAGGHVLAQISNSDSPVYNELWRYTLGRSTAIRIARSLAADASFSDNNVTSGVVYRYFARAYNGTGLFTDSDDSPVIYLTLSDSFLHIVSRTSTSSNAISSTAMILQDGSEFGLEEVAASHKLLGRARPVGVAGQAVWQTARVVGISLGADDTLAALMAIWRQGAVVCLRTAAGHRIFGKMTEPSSSVSVENVNVDAFGFTVTEEDYAEGL